MKLMNFIEGMGTVINLFPEMPQKTDFEVTSKKSVSEDIRESWQAVGKDLQRAIKNMDKLPKNEQR